MIIQGKVLKVNGDNTIEVTTERTGTCGNCHACFDGGSCAESITVSTLDRHKTGDKVSLELNNKYFFTAFLLVFVLPLTVFISSLIFLTSAGFSQWVVLIAGAALFFLTYKITAFYDRRLMKKGLYKLIN